MLSAICRICFLMRPDRFRAVIGLSVAFPPRGPDRPTTVMPQAGDAVFYQLYRRYGCLKRVTSPAEPLT